MVDKNKGISVKEAAGILNLTVQAVYQRMDKIKGFRDNHLSVDPNDNLRRYVIDEQGMELLKKYSEQNGYTKVSANTKKASSEDKQDEQSAKATFKEQEISELIAFYREQLKAKDKQLNQYSTQLAERAKESQELHELLRNSQSLQLMANQQVKELKQHVKELGGYITSDEENKFNSNSSLNDSSVLKDSVKKENNGKTKKGFWSRVFGK